MKSTILFLIILLCPSLVLADFSTLVSPQEGQVMSRSGSQYMFGSLVTVETVTGDVSFAGLRTGIRGLSTLDNRKYYQFVLDDADLQWLHENYDYLTASYPHSFNVTMKQWSLTPCAGLPITYSGVNQESPDSLLDRLDLAIINWTPSLPAEVVKPLDSLYSPFNTAGVVSALGVVLGAAVAIPLLFLAFNKVSRSFGGLK